MRRPTGKRYDEAYTISTMKHPPNTCFAENVIWTLVFPCGMTMNSSRNVELLSDKLKSYQKLDNTHKNRVICWNCMVL